MHPIYQGAPLSGSTTRHTFGIHGIQVQFNAALTTGYIVKQSGTNTFVVTDNSTTNNKLNTWKVKLAQRLPVGDNYFTIAIAPSAVPTGASFVFHYGVNMAMIAQAGTGYQVGDVLTLTLTGVGGATLRVTTIGTNGVITGASVSNAGDTLSANTTGIVGGHGSGATFDLTYKLNSVTASGGTGYAIGDPLTFTGFTPTPPTAHVSAVSGGAVTGVSVTDGGSITATGSMAVTAAEGEHVARIWGRRLRTIEGSTYKWSLGTSHNGSVALPVN